MFFIDLFSIGAYYLGFTTKNCGQLYKLVAVGGAILHGIWNILTGLASP